jgi:hypothetical protein
MLAAIDANCGGGLMKLQRKPTDEDFAMHLTNKPMVIRLGLWELKQTDGLIGKGNWVQAIASADKPVNVDASKVAKAQPKAQSNGGSYAGGKGTSYGDDEIPFSPCM